MRVAVAGFRYNAKNPPLNRRQAPGLPRPQPATCNRNLHPATCNLQLATCNPQPPTAAYSGEPRPGNCRPRRVAERSGADWTKPPRNL
ncbi:MAG: hypothetical protein EHM18_03910 [Acidobacteria bacterium]|nr:MAG: hypothetical protein EHM18_03910 [Acidobacteriota bacterium]